MMSRIVPALVGALIALAPLSANAQLTGFQEYYVPGKEDQLREIFRSFSVSVGNDMHAVISATAASDTVMYYDHWEDGYDFNPLDPENTYDEKIVIPAGTSHIFESGTIPSNPRNPADVFYDGGDRLFSAGRTVAVMRASWPEVPGPNLAISWEVYPVLANDATPTFVVPVGENFFPPPKKYDDFAQVHVLVMALQDNVTINIDDADDPGSPDCTVLLPTRGSTNKDTACEMRTGGRAKVTANGRISVQMLGGINQGGEDRMRSLNIPPSSLFGNEYFSPVPSFTGINTDLFLYNPSTTSSINVTVADAGGTNVVAIPADSTVSFETATGRFLAQNSAARITSPSTFYGFGAVSLGNSNYDWCFNLVRSTLLPEVQAVPWGPGAIDGADPGTEPDGNGSPIFITPSNDNTYVFIDFSPGDGVDDQVLLLDRGQMVKVYDPDFDNSGTTVQSIGPVAITWGADPETAGTGSPFFDLGYSLPPLLDAWIDPVLDIEHSAAPATLPVTGGTALVVIDVDAFSYNVNDVDVTDLLAEGWEYIAGSTTITLPSGAMITGTAANPSITGQLLTWDLTQDMAASQTMRIVFSTRTTGATLYGPNKFEATATGLFGATEFAPNAPAFVTVTPPPTVVKNLYLHADDRNFVDGAETERDLDRLEPVSGTESVVIANDAAQTWTLAPALSGTLGLPSSIEVKLWGDPVTGSGLAPDITVTLKSGSTVLGSDVKNDLDTGMVEHTFTITPTAAALPAGQTLTLEVSVKNGVGATFTVEYDSPSRNSRIDLPTYSYINIDSVGTFTAAYPGAVSQSTFDQGATEAIRAVVSDPFGAFDITGASVSVTRNGSPVETVTPTLVDTGAGTKTFEIVRNYTAIGNYAYTFTVNEGTEGTVTHMRAGAFVVADDDRDDDGITNANEAGLGTDPDDVDSDNDGLQDGTEIGLTAGQGLSTDPGIFIPDQDAASTTDPLDADTDDDLLLDGTEDTDHDGLFEPGNLETDPNNPDTDGDLIEDGTEDANLDGDYDAGTETDANDTDTDNDLILDGVEDANQDGVVNGNETDPRSTDSDADGIADGIEDFDRDGLVDAGETNPVDDDSDEDGLLDGNEDLDDDRVLDAGETDPLDDDTDDDLLSDGVEKGLAAAQGTDTIGFVADADTGTTTDARDDDSDDDGLTDGNEDLNRNGAVAATETDPNDIDSDDDFLGDGQELGLGTPQGTGTDLGVFAPDLNTTTTTLPLDDDSDDDGVLDGNEDADRDGALVATETDPNDFDSDDDSLSDGLELGRATPQGTGTNLLLFDADTDPATTTDPLDDDDDEDGLLDGSEDSNQDGAVGAAESDPALFDTDADFLSDGLERGLAAPQGFDTNIALFDPDSEPATTTNPADDDTDDDGLKDGSEDLDGDGFKAATETDPNLFDTDGDLLSDGLELGLSAPQGFDTNPATFRADGDAGVTTTDPLDADSDDDLVTDGFEDLNRNGVKDATEWDPNDFDTDNDGLSDGAEDADHDGVRDPGETDPLDGDTDNDLLTDGVEVNGSNPTNPFDDDSDDDGLLDGNEDTSQNGGIDAGESNPNSFDTDGDGLSDGKERGLVAAQGANTNPAVFQADSDPASTTSATDDDSDDDGLQDGNEDADRDGLVDANETNPNDLDTDDDFLQDGLEIGLAAPQGDDTNVAIFTPDTNPATQSLPLDDDSDDDGLLDGNEDANRNGNREITETRVTLFDTDADGLGDGQELGLTAPQGSDTDLADFIADSDGATTTLPLDDDSDDDGRLDGTEDTDKDGLKDATETNPGAFDTDADGLGDGQELGLAAPQGTGTNPAVFRADTNPASTTLPLDDDSDDDGIEDGSEDADLDGFKDVTETNPNAFDTDGDALSDGLEIGLVAPQGSNTNPAVFDADTDPASVTDPLDLDTDDDLLSDGIEDANGNGAFGAGETNPLDDDTDDDGLLDGSEDANGDGLAGANESDPRELDSDADGLQDGVEAGLVAPEGLDTNPVTFLADLDPLTTTNPADDDTDEDGLLDGSEDLDADGLKAATETDPNLFDTDGDLLSDGLELGLSAPQGFDTVLATFRADADAGLTTTDPLDADSDDDLVPDGFEDLDRDGVKDATEWNPNVPDTDGDGLEDGEEDTDLDGVRDPGETDPLDGDTDDDLLSDGVEVNGSNPTNPFDDDSDDDGLLDGNEDTSSNGGLNAGESNPNAFDTDGDALSDGKERGLAAPQGVNTNLGTFQADTHPASTTLATDDDSDNDGLQDGNEDADRDGFVDTNETDPNDLDTDDDLLQDGLELGLAAPQGDDTNVGVFTPDTNPASQSLPLDDDSDDDGLLDGNEDSNRNGNRELTETRVTLFDTDADGLGDGQELGLTAPQGSDTDPGEFVADSDGATTTLPLDDDTDNDGRKDGTEDTDKDGLVDATETDPNVFDTDGDGLGDGQEMGLSAPEGTGTSGAFLPDTNTGSTTNPLDDDTDDDGRTDGNEDTDTDGFKDASETNPNAFDTDGDGLSDGLEIGLAAPQGSDTNLAVFDADADTATQTDPLDTDTDDDFLSDGTEDADGNGARVPTETDPLDDDSDDDGRLDGTEDANDNHVVDAAETNPLSFDTDADGLSDGLEAGLANPEGLDTNLGIFDPDTHPASTTNPRDADTDDDGRADGSEDGDADGFVDTTETDPNVPDTDGDGIEDGVEVGLTVAEGGADSAGFVADADPGTTTDPLDDDSDDDGLLDGTEDANANGAVAANESDPNVLDSDADGLQDGVEAGLLTPEGSDTDLGVFLADTDSSTTTDPADDDTDDDGLLDGTEDDDGDGFVDATETDPNDPDTDSDGVQDGTELGLTTGEGSGTGAGFVPDADAGVTTTNPLDDDSDDDLLLDGTEDADGDGEFDVGPETDPNEDDTDGDLLTDGVEDANHDGDVDPGETDPRTADADNDGLSDGVELAGPVFTDPNDDDSDDDGILDGTEDANQNGTLDSGETSAANDDSDGDGIADGIELGLTSPQGNDTNGGIFVADADPATTTDPTIGDTDGDGLSDGVEDANQNGAVAVTETDPDDDDTDDDLVHDGEEVLGVLGTSALDDDSDDDGMIDGNEDLNRNGAPDAGESDPTDDDTDNDGLADGVEKGLTTPEGNDTGGSFVADGDGVSQTFLLDDDSDDDGLIDGNEDANVDGVTAADETAPNTADTDADGVEDGIESGLTAPQGVNTVGFLADADPASTTDSLDDDTDDDGLLDGSEDGDGNGAVAAIESDPGANDSDGDGILDGTEAGLSQPQGLDTDLGAFVADADPSTITSVIDDDSDDDGVLDGTEDVDHNGARVAAELNPLSPDTDGDQLQDGMEMGLTAPQGSNTNPAVFQADGDASTTTDPFDDDSDDDGLFDGSEDADHNGVRVATETDPVLLDSDADELGDGLEIGLTAAQGQDTDAALFVADADPDTVTDPLVDDTDGGGMEDGREDLDKNGRRDPLERNPLDGRDDTDPVAAGSGCSCSLDATSGGSAGGAPIGSLLLATGAFALAFTRRRRSLLSASVGGRSPRHAARYARNGKAAK